MHPFSSLSAVVLAFAAFACSCATSDSASPSGSSKGAGPSTAGVGGGSAMCTACVTDGDCPSGSLCGQFGGDTYCAPNCSTGQTCAADRACTTLADAEGAQIQICVPVTDVCGGTTGAGGATSTTGAGGTSEMCGTLDGPDVAACCSSCKSSGKPCQANGCYGGWWCNTQTCKCQAPPSCGSSSGVGGGGTGGNGGSVTGIDGGKLDTLNFAIVGDTRPAMEPASDSDTSGYPTNVIKQIWQDIETQNPKPSFAITTGDYMFAKPWGTGGSAQLDVYLGARAAYSNAVFPAMGNHECTGGTTSNCGTGTADGLTNNYKAFLSKMLTPVGVTQPYYTVTVGSTTNAWTAKFVFVAANAWSSAQSSWFASALAQPTTYTFVVRHEGTIATTAPGVPPSAQIMTQHPYTILIAGHTHTYAHYTSSKEVIVGNGGAPLSSGVNYGYVIARQQPDGSLLFREYDYSTNAVMDSFNVKPDGSP